MQAALNLTNPHLSTAGYGGRRPRHLQVVRPTTRTTRAWLRPVPTTHGDGVPLDPFHEPRTPVRWQRVQRTPAAVYRRRRLAVALAVLALTFAAGVVFSVVALSSPAGGTLTPAAEEAQRARYVVEPGDTLWGVAAEVAPEEDRREVVDALAEARGTSTLVPGDVIVWPLPGS